MYVIDVKSEFGDFAGMDIPVNTPMVRSQYGMPDIVIGPREDDTKTPGDGPAESREDDLELLRNEENRLTMV